MSNTQKHYRSKRTKKRYIMSKHVRNILNGAKQALVLMPASGYVVPSKSDLHADVRSLREDGRRVARDLNKALRKYGK